MKLQPDDTNIERSGEFVESMFGISEQDSSHILMILRDKLYSNKILAVVREYCSNAYDAHVEVGCDTKPFNVFLPTKLDPRFRVYDYGPGLSEDDVRNLYVMYGASTKRKTNDVIGQLGLGCKSAFAYAEQFIVISRHNGKKSSYCAYIDETKCGKIALMSSEDSDEDDGIEIQVPVKPEDFETFKHEAIKLLRFFSPIPKITGAGGSVTAPQYWITGTLPNGVHWGIFDNNRESSDIIMGGISYKLSARPLGLSSYDDKLGQLIDLGIHLFINIGDAEVAANRETLEYTDHTINSINNSLAEAADDILKQASSQISDAMTYRDANDQYRKLHNNQRFWKHLNTKALWQGKPLDGLALCYSSEYVIYSPWRSGRGWRWSEVQNAKVGNDLILFEIDNPTNWKQRVRSFAKYHGIDSSNIYAIKFTNPQSRDTIFATRQLDEYMVYKVSQCNVPKAAKVAGFGNIAPRSTSHIGKIFSLVSPKNWDRENKAKRSSHWQKVDDPPADGKTIPYVILDSFIPYALNSVDASSLREIRNLTELATLAGVGIYPTYVHGVKRKHVSKLESNWQLLGNVVQDAIVASDLLQKLANAQEYEIHTTDAITTYIDERHGFSKNSLMFKMLDTAAILSIIYDDLSGQYLRLKAFIHDTKLDVPSPSLHLGDLVTQVKARYPLPESLEAFPGESKHGNSRYRSRYYRTADLAILKDALPHIIKYVELIDSSIKKGKRP